MSIRDNMKKVLIVAGWCLAGTGVLVLLVAAINRKNNKTCKSYRVEINGGKSHLFLNNADVMDLLTAHGADVLTGKPIVSFRLKRMEDLLKHNPWVKDANLFFDNQDVLRIKVTERQPVARIITSSGNSFYIDSSAVQLPLPAQGNAKLPVFTGYPSEKIRTIGKDSALAQQVKQLAVFLLQDPFWMADIEQVAITPDRNFEMVPVIGNHLIEFGDGTDYEKKFHRLFIFYKEVSTRVGFDKYAKIDVRYAGQVVATKKGNYPSRYDSLQALKNIQQLIRSAQQIMPDTLKQQSVKPLEQNTETEQTLKSYDLVDDEPDSSAPPKTGKPVKPATTKPKQLKKQ